MLCPVGDHILQEFNTLYLTRFRTPNNNLEGRGIQSRPTNTSRKIHLQVNFLDDDSLHCFLSV
jgi:hypothetical protein